MKRITIRVTENYIQEYIDVEVEDRAKEVIIYSSNYITTYIKSNIISYSIYDM